MTTLEYRYGPYLLSIRYQGNDYAQVTMYDISELRFPLLWSTGMTYSAANGAKALFESIGYFDMPV